MSDRGIRILVIDGEGAPAIGVVPSVRVLDEMMSRIAFDEDKPQESILPCEYFDLIVGSGDGGWIALMLGRLGMSASRTKTVYEEIHSFIHNDCASLDPTEKAVAFELRLKKLVCDETKNSDPELEKLQEPKTTEPRCKVAVLTKAALNIGAPILLRTYRVRDNQTANYPAWTAMRACTARPNVFPHVELRGHTLISASLGHNNPNESAMHEALAAFPNSRVDCIVSLGSGHPGHSELQPSNMDSLAKAAMELAQGSELVSQEFAKRRHIEGRIYALAGYGSALAHTEAYLQDPSIGESLNDAISALRGEQQSDISVIQPLPTSHTSASGIIHASNAPPIQTYVYALYDEGFGLPLWDPQPLYKATPVEIGDVGILTKLGAFQVLFNATLPAVAQETVGYRIPPDFEPISILSSDIEVDPDVLQVPFLAHGDVIPSGQGLESTPTTQRQTQQPFNLSFAAMNGAALVIKDPPTELALTPERKIEEYIRNNCRAWYHYYEHDPQGPRRNLHGSSLIFVTAVVQNSRWALGAWSSLGTPIEVSYSGSATTSDGKFLDIAGRWAPPGRRDVKQGPSSTRGVPRSKLRQQDDPDNILAPLTQTLFVRGYVIGVRDTRPETLEPSKVYPLPYNSWTEFLRKISVYGIPTILRAAAEARDLPPPPPPPTAPAVAVEDSSGDESTGVVEARELPSRPQLRHPGDDIMNNMFKIDPSLEIIVLHDDTIADLMRDTETSQKEQPVNLLSSLEITTTNSLQDKDVAYEDYPNLQATRNLPNDLLLYIFSICDARTIGKLRQCCKEFHDLSHSQIVWLEVLKTTCAALSLPTPSLHQDERSNSDIELLATAWVRFQRVLQNAREDMPPLYKAIRLIKTTGRILALQQSPDGRFLFVVNTDGIRVWNLQTTSPNLLGSLAVEIPGEGWCSLTVENESDHTFIVPLLIEDNSKKSSQWVAFRVKCPRYAGGEVQFDLLSQVNRQRFSAKFWGGWSMHPPLPMMVTTFEHSTKSKYYLLWNVVEGTCAIWAADANDVKFQSSPIINRDFIVNAHRTSQETIVYALPELPPKDSYAPEICAELSNPVLMHIPPVASIMNRQLVSPALWKTSFNGGNAASDHEARGSICEMRNGNWVLELMTLERTNTPNAFAPLPLKLERSILLPIRDRGSFPISGSIHAYTCPDRTLILDGLSKDRNQIGVHVSAPTEGSDGNELGRGVLYDSNKYFELKDSKYDLCPFTGRLCVAVPGDIEVVDFVESRYL